MGRERRPTNFGRLERSNMVRDFRLSHSRSFVPVFTAPKTFPLNVLPVFKAIAWTCFLLSMPVYYQATNRKFVLFYTLFREVPAGTARFRDSTLTVLSLILIAAAIAIALAGLLLSVLFVKSKRFPVSLILPLIFGVLFLIAII